MLATILRVKWGLLMVALTGGVLAGGSGTAVAAEKLVLSDTVTFKAVWTPSSGSFQSSSCKVKSDGETVAFPCTITGQFIPSGSSALIGATWSSADGTTTVPVLLAPQVASKPPVTTYKGTGPCTEREMNDLPGGTGEVSYECQATPKVAFNSAKNTLNGSFVVRELPRLP
jgi:hypothetical protein